MIVPMGSATPSRPWKLTSRLPRVVSHLSGLFCDALHPEFLGRQTTIPLVLLHRGMYSRQAKERKGRKPKLHSRISTLEHQAGRALGVKWRWRHGQVMKTFCRQDQSTFGELSMSMLRSATHRQSMEERFRENLLFKVLRNGYTIKQLRYNHKSSLHRPFLDHLNSPAHRSENSNLSDNVYPICSCTRIFSYGEATL